MSKFAKTFFTIVLSILTLVILLGLTVIIIDKATGYIFFANEIFCIYRISPFFILWIGVLGEACTILIFCIKKKAKRLFMVLLVAVIVVSLISTVFSLLKFTIERKFYYESSPNGKNEIIICSYQFLVVSSGDVYYRVNPFFICRLTNEENKHVEWFYDDYTIEWHDGYVLVDGYTYLLPER